MSFYEFGLGGGKKDADDDKSMAAIEALANEMTVKAKQAIVDVSEAAGPEADNRTKIVATQVACVSLFGSMLGATLNHPEPGRTMLAKVLYDFIVGGTVEPGVPGSSILNMIGAIASLAGHTKDRGDGTLELRA